MLAFIRLPVPPANKTNPTLPISGTLSSSPEADTCDVEMTELPRWRDGGCNTKDWAEESDHSATKATFMIDRMVFIIFLLARFATMWLPFCLIVWRFALLFSTWKQVRLTGGRADVRVALSTFQLWQTVVDFTDTPGGLPFTLLYQTKWLPQPTDPIETVLGMLVNSFGVAIWNRVPSTLWIEIALLSAAVIQIHQVHQNSLRIVTNT